MPRFIEEIRATDIRDWGLVSEDTIDIQDLDDIEALLEGIDEDGVAQ